MDAGTFPLILREEFHAPLPELWAAFTVKHRLASWWGPAGIPVEVLEFDPTPGGRFFYALTGPEGVMMHGLFEYHRVESGRLIRFVNGFADGAGHLIRAPFSPLYPLRILNELHFTHRGNRSSLTWQLTPYCATGREEAFFEGMKGQIRQGFEGTFEVLKEFLGRTA